eukprot:2465241-Amphidinium_carterae.1
MAAAEADGEAAALAGHGDRSSFGAEGEQLGQDEADGDAAEDSLPIVLAILQRAVRLAELVCSTEELQRKSMPQRSARSSTLFVHVRC